MITFFEIVGHCIQASEDDVGLGFAIGKKDGFGIGKSFEDEETGERWYGIDDYADLLTAVFDPKAEIELEGCHSADPRGAVGHALKNVLPSATIEGYTSNCEPIFGYPWETCECLGSQWTEIEIGTPDDECPEYECLEDEFLEIDCY